MENSCNRFLHRVMSVACFGCFGYKMADGDSEESVRLATGPRRCGRCNGAGHRRAGKSNKRMLRQKTPLEEGACFEAMQYFDDDDSSGKTPPPPLLRKGQEGPWCTTRSETDVTPTGSRPSAPPPCACCPHAHPVRGRRADCALTCQASCGDGAWAGPDDETHKAVETPRGWTAAKRVTAGNARRSKAERKMMGLCGRRQPNKIKVDYGCHCSEPSKGRGGEERKRPYKSSAPMDHGLSGKSSMVEERKQPNESNFAEAIVQTREPKVDGACRCATPSHSVAEQQRKQSDKSIAAAEQRQPSTVIVENTPSTTEVVSASRRASQRSAADSERKMSNKSNDVQEQRPSKTSRVDNTVDGCYCDVPKRSVDKGLDASEKHGVENRRSSNRSNVIEEKRHTSKDAFAEGQLSSLASVNVPERKRSSREAVEGAE